MSFKAACGNGKGAAGPARSAVLSALLVREFQIKTKGYGFVGFAAAIMEPIIHIMILVAWHGAIRLTPRFGSSTLLYVATGVYPHFFFVHLSSGFRGPLRANRLMRRFGPESSLDVVYVHALMLFVAHCIVGLILFTSIYLFDTKQAEPTDYGPLFRGVISLSLFGFGVGLINAALNQIIPFWRFFYAPMSRLMMLFSGVYFVPEYLSKSLQDIVVWNPLLHAMKEFRLAFYPKFPQLLLREDFLWCCVVIALVLGFAVERCTRKMVDEKT